MLKETYRKLNGKSVGKKKAEQPKATENVLKARTINMNTQ